MKQIRVDAFGGPDQLRLVDAPDPVPAAGEVVVAIATAGVNFSDLLQRAGLYTGGPTPPYVAGSEAAGTVIAHGRGVGDPPLGAHVIALARTGLYAERAAVPAAHCIPLPSWLDLRTGAAFAVGYLTAYHALVTVAHARAGERVLVHAAAGALGAATVDIARALGLAVVATASPAKLASLPPDVTASTYDAFERHGEVDIVVDGVGGELTRRGVNVLAPLGRLVLVGAASGQVPVIDPVKLVMRSRAVLGLHLDAILARPALVADALAWFAAHPLTPRIGHALPLADAARAHELVASRASTGKVVLYCAP